MELNDLLNYNLLEVGTFHFKVATLFTLVTFYVVVVVLLQVFKKTLNRVQRIEAARRYAIYSLVQYFVFVIAAVISLQILGFNISVLLAGSAALLVGLGLGLQNLFSDFVSGIILLADSSIRVHDVIEVDGIVCTVQEINLRTTTVLTRDDHYIILPNTLLTRNKMINWSHQALATRFEVRVGVDYGSDVKLVMRLMKEAVETQQGVLKAPVPFVRFEDYGESSLNFSVYFWSENVFRIENTKSDIRVRLFEAFKTHDVVIPFPQRVIHSA